ncbi:MAG TPA: hypothetical protein EYQ01_01150, partial [Nitrospira sp.]|nr:hypothetical protein [Candidatus Manganitrophaceae bacterium]
MNGVMINRRKMLQGMAAGVGTVAGLSPLITRAGSSRIAPATSAKNLVIIVNMLGYNRHTFHPKGDDLDKSPLLARLKGHY